DDPALEASVKVNVPENARLTFDHVANDKIQEMIDSNFKFYKQITDDPEFEKFFLGWLFERYKRRAKGAGRWTRYEGQEAIPRRASPPKTDFPSPQAQFSLS